MYISPVSFNCFSAYNPCVNKNYLYKSCKKNNELDFKSAQMLRTMAFLDLSFKGKSVPVYVINEQGEYTKYNKISDAVNSCGLQNKASSVRSCVAGKINSIDGYIFVRASEIEEEIDGKTVVTQKKINQIIDERLNSKSVYKIEVNGNYTKYPSSSALANDLNLKNSNGSISACLYGKRNFVDGCIIAWASDIESETVDGKKEVDIIKLNKIISDRMPSRSIYAIDENGNCTKFKSQKEAIRVLNLSTSRHNLSDCVYGDTKKVGGYIFVFASEIESEDENGIKFLDSEKIKKVMEERTPASTAIYSFDSSGKYQKYNSIKEASEQLNVPYVTIWACLSGNSKSLKNGCSFVGASEIETKGENGQVFVDEQKLGKIIDEKFYHSSIYRIDKNGECKQYKSHTVAAIDIGLKPYSSAISECLAENRRTTRGYIFVYPEQIEHKLKDGTVVLDKKKIQALIDEKIAYKAVYAVDSDKNILKFNSPPDAEKELGLRRGSVAKVLSGVNKNSKGYSFFWASDVERVYDGEKVLDKYKLLHMYKKKKEGIL